MTSDLWPLFLQTGSAGSSREFHRPHQKQHPLSRLQLHPVSLSPCAPSGWTSWVVCEWWVTRRRCCSRRNILPEMNDAYLRSCRRTNDSLCPIFKLGDIVREAGEKFSEMAVEVRSHPLASFCCQWHLRSPNAKNEELQWETTSSDEVIRRHLWNKGPRLTDWSSTFFLWKVKVLIHKVSCFFQKESVIFSLIQIFSDLQENLIKSCRWMYERKKRIKSDWFHVQWL